MSVRASGVLLQPLQPATMAAFGEVLQSIGEFGRFQKITLFALCVPNVIVSFHFASVYFTQADPERHCNTDWILRAEPHLSAEEQLNLTVPRGADGALSRCRMFVPVDRDIESIRRFGLNETAPCADGWVYDSTLYVATIVTDVSGSAHGCFQSTQNVCVRVCVLTMWSRFGSVRSSL